MTGIFRSNLTLWSAVFALVAALFVLSPVATVADTLHVISDASARGDNPDGNTEVVPLCWTVWQRG